MVISQSIIILTLKSKSLLPSLCKREEFPLLGKEGPGEILEEYVWSIMDSLVITQRRGGLRTGKEIQKGRIFY